MNVLVTGGAGFIGSHLTDMLLDDGNQVVVLDDLSTGNLENLKHCSEKPGFHPVEGSILDQDLVASLVEKSDIVYHLAASVGVALVVDNLCETLDNNVRGTENIIKHANRCGGKKVVLASTSEIYGKSLDIPYKEDGDLVMGPTSVGRWGYACSKMLDELLALSYYKEHGLPVVILRFFNTVGPRQSGRYGMVLPRFVLQALQDKPITVHGDGTQSRCFTYVGDAVRAMVGISVLTQAEGQVFNLGSEREISINQLASTVKQTLNSGSPIVHVPYDAVFGTDFEDIHRRVPDISKIRRFIDFRADTQIEQIILEVADALAPSLADSNCHPE